MLNPYTSGVIAGVQLLATGRKTNCGTVNSLHVAFREQRIIDTANVDK